MTKLFTPLVVGHKTLPNRVFMAPLTRLRSIEPGDIPTPLMGEYYAQRHSSGLIITEATQVSFQAKGYAGAPGLHTPEQTAAWKKIVAGVHAKDGHIAVQLWHVGRISHTSLQPNQQPPVAPSAIAAGTRTSLRDENGNAAKSARRRVRWKPLKSRGSLTTSARQQPIRVRPVSTTSSCTRRTAICCTSSSLRLLTNAKTSTAAALKIALA
jgi:hypothetical protein